MISTHTPLAGRDTSCTGTPCIAHTFLLTRPLRDVTPPHQLVLLWLWQFLLTRPLRDVTGSGTFRRALMRFLLTRPLRDVTGLAGGCDILQEFLLTRPLRDVTRCRSLFRRRTQISTHTPLAGRDGQVHQCLPQRDISTHTPLAGRDQFHHCSLRLAAQFLLTRPLRDVTHSSSHS